ncbi:hypothetical protein JCM33374_g5347 [Metschnikowia sp. JCM 33374]|nr:hypothetical protein JCM33374_g5347 [Metschnikowia sp. JCM 33374]
MIRQYLNLGEILSQTWLDPNIIFMVLATLKVYFFSAALISAVSLIRDSSLPLCRSFEALASEMESAPAQMSRMTTSLLHTMADNIHVLVDKSVYLSATVAKGIVSLILELYLGTLTCLLTALIKGTLELVSDILGEITSFVQNAINAVLKEFNAALSGLSTVINGITTAVNAIESLFSSADKSKVTNNINKVNLTVSSLKSIAIPTTWISDIENLANEVPDFEDVLSNVSSLLTAPITDLTKGFSNSSFNFTLNDSLLVSSSTDPSVIPKIASTSMNSFSDPNATQSICNDVELVLSEAVSATRSLTKYLLIGLCIGTVSYAMIACIFDYFHQRKRTRLYKSLAKSNNPIEAGNSIGDFEDGFLAIFMRSWKPESRWIYSYLTTSNLTKCLFLGLLGWVIVLLQFITLQQTSKFIDQIIAGRAISPETKTKLVNEFSDYLDDAQVALNRTVNEINVALFSSIHNTSSEMLYGIGFFQGSVNNTINAVFGSSFLAKPLRTIIYCTIGRKVDSIETGLEWIQNNTQFYAPEINKTYMKSAFSDSTLDSSSMPSKIVDNIIEALQKLIKSQKKALWKEFFIATAFVAVWFLYLIVGLILVAKRKVHGTVTSEKRISAQEIGWPTQLGEEAKREYNYPYNDPYGFPYLETPQDPTSQLKNRQGVSPGSSSGQHLSPHRDTANDQKLTSK